MKFYLVTGGNKGIGLAVIERILNDITDSYVLMGSRDVQRGLEAVDGLIKDNESFNSRIQVIQLDVERIDSIVEASKKVESFLKQKNGKLTGLVNNAGIYDAKDIDSLIRINVEGVYNVSNHFAHLIHSTDARIVNVSSQLAAGLLSRCNEKGVKFFHDEGIAWKEIEAKLEALKKDSDFRARTFTDWGVSVSDKNALYAMSKAFVNLITVLFAKRYPNIKVNCCHPGWVMTDLTLERYAKGDKEKALKMGMIRPKDSTVSTFHLLTATLEGNGKYYDDKGILVDLSRKS